MQKIPNDSYLYFLDGLQSINRNFSWKPVLNSLIKKIHIQSGGKNRVTILASLMPGNFNASSLISALLDY